MSAETVLIAAGGTGGHLFPAFSLCEELKRRGIECDLVTDERAGQYGIDFPGRAVHHVPSATLRGKSPVAVARMVMTLLSGVLAARRLIGKIKPSVIVGFGGYPTVPPVLAARIGGVPSVIHDANAVLGRANKLLASVADVIALAFENTKHVRTGKKVRVVGMPVRDAVKAARRDYPKRSGADPFRLLVFGGSQGAKVFGDIVPDAIAALPQALKARLKLVQQVREEDLERVHSVYEAARIDAELQPFFSDLPERIADAHLVIARSGASTIAELTVLGRPALLVPFPHALDNDQLENATRLQEVGGAWCIEQKDFTPDRLRDDLAALAAEPEKLEHAAVAAASAGKADAVERLADIVEDLMRASRES